MFEFVSTLAKVLPFLSRIIGFSTWIVAFCLTLVLWFLVIWLAWIAVRPVVWISCLVVSIAGIIWLIKLKKSKKDNNNSKSEEISGEIIEC